MMKKNISNPFKKLAVLTLVPALSFFLWAFAEPEFEQHAPQTLPENYTLPDSILYVIDGKITYSMTGISPNDIEAISILKNEAATSKYGEKGKNGVIIITTKEAANKSSEAETSIKIESFLKVVDIINNIDGQKQTKRNPLYIIDGKEVTDIDSLNPAEIESISVLKGGSASEKFGVRGENGVVIITMKKAKSE